MCHYCLFETTRGNEVGLRTIWFWSAHPGVACTLEDVRGIHLSAKPLNHIVDNWIGMV